MDKLLSVRDAPLSMNPFSTSLLVRLPLLLRHNDDAARGRLAKRQQTNRPLSRRPSTASCSSNGATMTACRAMDGAGRGSRADTDSEAGSERQHGTSPLPFPRGVIVSFRRLDIWPWPSLAVVLYMTGVPSDDSCSIVLLRTVPSSSSPSAGSPPLTAPPPLLVAITATNLAPCHSLRACQSGQSAYRQPATSPRPQSFHSSRYPIPVPTGPPSNIGALTAASSKKNRAATRSWAKPHHQKNRTAEP
ncbi:hypothetical protein HDK90DRAFT_316644 [Phyllosticta capitalensis]|uniref:Uncharacterized protein n=1 Tax=Phyllosticta capitalensis TaxID=121624 RepID=A0ABR1YLC2_9PEZI